VAALAAAARKVSMGLWRRRWRLRLQLAARPRHRRSVLLWPAGLAPAVSARRLMRPRPSRASPAPTGAEHSMPAFLALASPRPGRPAALAAAEGQPAASRHPSGSHLLGHGRNSKKEPTVSALAPNVARRS